MKFVIYKKYKEMDWGIVHCRVNHRRKIYRIIESLYDDEFIEKVWFEVEHTISYKKRKNAEKEKQRKESNRIAMAHKRGSVKISDRKADLLEEARKFSANMKKLERELKSE